MNTVPKYVVSNTLKRADWNPSTIISGDVAAQVAKLKAQPGGELLVYGSADLVDELLRHDLVDEYRLLDLPSHPGERQAPVPRSDRHPPPAPGRDPPLRVGGRAAHLRARIPRSRRAASSSEYQWTHEQLRSLQAAEDIDRTLATVLFADIVDSTGRAARDGRPGVEEAAGAAPTRRPWRDRAMARPEHRVRRRRGDGDLRRPDPGAALRLRAGRGSARPRHRDPRGHPYRRDRAARDRRRGHRRAHRRAVARSCGARPGRRDEDRARPGYRHRPHVQPAGRHEPAWRSG